MPSGDAAAIKSLPLQRIAKIQIGAPIVNINAYTGSARVFGAHGTFGYTDRANTNGPTIIISRKITYKKEYVYWSDAPCWATDATFFINADKTIAHFRWLYYALQTLDFNGELGEVSLNREQLGEKRLRLPDVQTQTQIANYLDRATQRLEQLITEKQTLLELCEEKRSTLVNQAITSGLCAVGGCKDSGIIWPEAIPEDWQCVALKRLSHSIVRGKRLRTTHKPANADGLGVIQKEAINYGYFNAAENKTLVANLDFPAALAIQQNDVFITRTGDIALANASYRQLTFSEELLRLRVDSNKVAANWLVCVLLSDVGRIQVTASKKDARVSSLKPSDVSEWMIPLPPMPQQRAIGDYVQAELAKLNELAQATQQSIALLRERRTALLADAMTGQLNLKEIPV